MELGAQARGRMDAGREVVLRAVHTEDPTFEDQRLRVSCVFAFRKKFEAAQSRQPRPLDCYNKKPSFSITQHAYIR